MRECVQAGLQPDTAIYNAILRLLSDQSGAGGGPGPLEAIVAEMEARLAPLFCLATAFGYYIVHKAVCLCRLAPSLPSGL